MPLNTARAVTLRSMLAAAAALGGFVSVMPSLGIGLLRSDKPDLIYPGERLTLPPIPGADGAP